MLFCALLATVGAPANGQSAVGFGDEVLHLGPTGYASILTSQFQDLNYQNDMSVEVAFNIVANAAGGRYPIILGKKNAAYLSDPGFCLSTSQGQFSTVGQQIYAVVADGTNQAALTSRSFQGIVHAVMTWSATNKVLQLYINGSLEASMTNLLVATNLTNSHNLNLGSQSLVGTLQRDILFARLWNRRLSAAEVSSVWNQFTNAGLHSLPASFSRTALVSEWLMDQTTGSGSSYLADTQDSNPLELQGGATLWQGYGPLLLQFPTNGAVNVSKSVTLEAAGGAGTLGTNVIRPLHYNFQVDEANTFNSAALRTSGWLNQYATWKPELKPSTTYFWRVQVQDSSPSPLASGFVATNAFTTMAASSWYVRPGVYTNFNGNTGAPIAQAGVYGTQNGTSYQNAWNGIQSIVWGAGGVEPADSLYLCGTHWFMASNNNFIGSSTTAYISESGYSTDFPITIRMDYAQDPGTLWGVWCNGINGGPTWHGPDANGVFISSNVSYSADYFANGTNVVLLNRETASTWTNDYGATFMTNGVWYVKTPDGSNPAGKICVSGLGYRFNLGRSSNICFLNCRLYNKAPAWDIASFNPNQDTQTQIPLSTYITFDTCDIRYNSEIIPTPGNDHWTVTNCELAFSCYGVYTFLNDRPFGANYLTVVNNFIHDMGTARFPDPDGHGIGVQGGQGHVIQGNIISNTGAAIEFYTDTQPMSNIVICDNFIQNIRVEANTVGQGIGVGGLNADMVVGQCTGIKIYGNIIMNTGIGATQNYQGYGIVSGCKDYVDIANNVVYQPQSYGIALFPQGVSVQARVVNNIIVNPQFGYFEIIGATSSANLLIDNNLYYSNSPLANPFNLYPSSGHDQHSVFNNPLFVSTNPAVALDFRLSSSSKAIQAGIPVGLLHDFSGTPYPAAVPPDIGAYKFVSTPPAPPSNLHVIPPGQ